MEEIKIGEYIRLDNGEIGKVIDIKENPKRVVCSQYGEIALCSNIVKHREELIDLVKPGDFVNGHLVVEISNNVYNQKLVVTEVDGKDGAIRHHYLQKSIKTILTKEMYAQYCYKVVGEEECM